MKGRLWVASTTILTLLLLSGTALAGGWGPYFSWDREEPTVGINEYGVNIKGDGRLDHFSFGIMYESAPARDQLLSYRGTLGFDIATNTKIENIQVENIPIAVPTFDLNQSSKYGVSTNHTLAFGIVRTDRLKWWVGPGIGLSFNYYDNVDLESIFGVQLPITNGEAGHLSVGGGAETGVNVHLGAGMTLCVGGGFHWRAFGFAAGSNDIGSLVWGDGPLYFIQTSLLFRTGDDRG